MRGNSGPATGSSVFDSSEQPPRLREGQRATRVFRIAVIAAVVLGAEWSLADPAAVSANPDLRPLPWAMLCLLFPIALGVWAYEVTSQDVSQLKADFLWSVLVGTLCYAAVALYALVA
jgi:hypothetical protein